MLYGINVNFWIFVSILILLSILTIAFAILRKVANNTDAHHQRIVRNVKLYQRRLASFEQELQEDFISQQHFDSLTNELARQLLNDVSQLKHAPAQSHKRKKWLYLLLPTPLLALILYGAIGAYPDWLISRQLDALSASKTIEEYTQRTTELHQQLEKRLQQKPEHLVYRNLLAQFFMGQRNYEQAALHYGILAELLPEDADILALYVQAEYLRNGREITTDIAAIMDRALRINPRQVTVLGIQGIHALEVGDLQSAINAWERLLPALPPSSEQAQLIKEGIKKAKLELGQVIEDSESVDMSAGISVLVNLDKTLSKLDGELPVFIFATAVDGPPMPLAAKKIHLKDLPIEIKLDDSMAMMPEIQLSNFDKINIVARISLSGEAIAKPGDWQGEVSAILWKETKNVTITIATLVE